MLTMSSHNLEDGRGQLLIIAITYENMFDEYIYAIRRCVTILSRSTCVSEVSGPHCKYQIATESPMSTARPGRNKRYHDFRFGNVL